MDKKRVEEILKSQGVINVTYNNDPVWLQPNSTDKDGIIQVRDMNTDKLMTVDIRDLKE